MGVLCAVFHRPEGSFEVATYGTEALHYRRMTCTVMWPVDTLQATTHRMQRWTHDPQSSQNFCCNHSRTGGYIWWSQRFLKFSDVCARQEMKSPQFASQSPQIAA